MARLVLLQQQTHEQLERLQESVGELRGRVDELLRQVPKDSRAAEQPRDVAESLDAPLDWLGEYLSDWSNELLGLIVAELEQHKKAIIATLPSAAGTTQFQSGSTASLLPGFDRHSPGRQTQRSLFRDEGPDDAGLDAEEPMVEAFEKAPAPASLAAMPEAPVLPPITLFEPGDAVTFERDGREEFGEIVALNDATNQATVMLIPSMEEVTVSQDHLTREQTDDDECDVSHS